MAVVLSSALVVGTATATGLTFTGGLDGDVLAAMLTAIGGAEFVSTFGFACVAPSLDGVAELLPDAPSATATGFGVDCATSLVVAAVLDPEFVLVAATAAGWIFTGGLEAGDMTGVGVVNDVATFVADPSRGCSATRTGALVGFGVEATLVTAGCGTVSRAAAITGSGGMAGNSNGQGPGVTDQSVTLPSRDRKSVNTGWRAFCCVSRHCTHAPFTSWSRVVPVNSPSPEEIRISVSFGVRTSCRATDRHTTEGSARFSKPPPMIVLSTPTAVPGDNSWKGTTLVRKSWS
jgi:hypothetical protein